MVFLNYSTMEMVAKIVYYGPGLCGKTTNLQTIYKKTSPHSRGEMVSLATETDRTLFFDLLPMEVGVIGGFKTKLQLYTVPGQVFYNTTRKLVLRGVDGIVFVADSQIPMMDANVESFQNLKDNLAELNLNLDDIPLVLQYNKRDLPSVLTLDELNTKLNPKGSYSSQEASALNGNGVFETLREVTRLTLMVLNQRSQKKDEPEKPAAANSETPSGFDDEPPRPQPPSSLPDEPAPMPTDVSFDDDDSETDISATFEDDRSFHKPGPKDSFEQTLDNMDLDLADDDEFLDDDSLDIEEFDEWEEDDSLEASLGEAMDPMSDFADEEDGEPITTLNLDEEAEPIVSSIEDLEISDDEEIEEDDITLDGHVDLDDDAMSLDLPTSEIPIPDAISNEAMIEDFELQNEDAEEEEAPPADFGSMDLDASVPDMDIEPDLTDHSLPDLSAAPEENVYQLDMEEEPALESQDLDDGLDFNLDEMPDSLDLDNPSNAFPAQEALDVVAEASEIPLDDAAEEPAEDVIEDIAENEDDALDRELDAVLGGPMGGSPQADEEESPALIMEADDDEMPVMLDDDDPVEEEPISTFEPKALDEPAVEPLTQEEPEQLEEANEPVVAEAVSQEEATESAEPVKGSEAVAKAAEKLKRPKRKSSSGLDELKRLTTRIQTSSLTKKKDKDIGSLLDGLGKTTKKKSTVEKHKLEIPGEIDAAQLNLVLLDADENVVHTQLLKATPRKVGEGKYQIKLVLDLENPDA